MEAAVLLQPATPENEAPFQEYVSYFRSKERVGLDVAHNRRLLDARMLFSYFCDMRSTGCVVGGMAADMQLRRVQESPVSQVACICIWCHLDSKSLTNIGRSFHYIFGTATRCMRFPAAAVTWVGFALAATVHLTGLGGGAY
ncbi:hypothetical protein cyc_01970 [Cyclospora cayetanensis]|uniref:Uncharacterized protein n=1 Tax=Cyclospora cayetanensis TaxID=88456 RepID=A0A1D3CZJ3_9EIME|nr:hypothetical protein cyc_01970 [Cyclospora cayetanensis]